jgi:nitroreductase
MTITEPDHHDHDHDHQHQDHDQDLHDHGLHTSPLALDPAAQDLLFREARTARSFTDEPVSDAQIAAMYDLVRWAPSSMNIQPLRIVLVRSDQARARLISHLAPGNVAKVESAPLVAVLAADVDFHEHLPTLLPHAPNARDQFTAPDAREQLARTQAWLQAGYVLLGIRALGLAAGPIGGFDAGGVDADLLAGTPLRSILVVNIGRPAEGAWHERLPRLPYDEVVTTL